MNAPAAPLRAGFRWAAPFSSRLRALDHREERFLDVAKTLIYQRPASPYRILLDHAGCALADLQRHVRGHGLEATLARLAQEGVYLTASEFKGKSDVVRGTTAFRVSPADLARPDSAPGLMVQSSGTRPVPNPGDKAHSCSGNFLRAPCSMMVATRVNHRVERRVGATDYPMY